MHFDLMADSKTNPSVDPNQPRPAALRQAPPVRDGLLDLTARSLKLTIVLDPAQLMAVTVPEGSGPLPFAVAVGGRRVTGQLNPRTLRRVLNTLVEHGPEKVAVVLQGRLETGVVLAEAGITAQVRVVKDG